MIVVDASVCVKWFVREEGHGEAVDLLESGRRLVAPDLVLAEVLHALRKKVRRAEMQEVQFVRASQSLGILIDQFVGTAEVMMRWSSSRSAWTMGFTIASTSLRLWWLVASLSRQTTYSRARLRALGSAA